ncbi:MAG TPA: pyridoxal phosphate-dependent aminotransferase [Bryobacteraceae bacterium]|nr:pyridoxal phosphate-dependent aminotransferase [Bryobacteraceae bacterium]
MYRYSRRLPWSTAPNAFSCLLQQERQAGARLLDLTISNPTEAFEDYPHDRIASAFSAVRDFSYHPDATGHVAARRAIAADYRARGLTIQPEQLLLTASTSEAYALLFKLFCDPGDEVLAPLPSYPLFEYLAGLESVRIVPYRLRYDGSWFIDMASLRQSVSPCTRALIIVNPNNPTGSFLKQHEAEELFHFATAYGLPVISDEVFMDYSFGAYSGRVPTLIGTESVLSFSLNGLSKAAGMPQMKLAWIALSGPEPARECARQRLELLSDTYLSVGTPVQYALPELLRIGSDMRHSITQRLARNLAALQAKLANTPAHCLHVEGGWSAIVQLPRTSTEEIWITRLLEEKSVIVQPGYFFDMDSEAYLVLSLLTPPETFDEGVRRLSELVKK